MENPTNIPTIDLSVFLRDDDEQGKKAAAKELIGRASEEYGFFLLTNHGIPQDLMSRAMELSNKFFSLPDEDKFKSGPRSGGPIPTGYNKQPAQNEYLIMLPPHNLLPETETPPGFRAALEEIFTYFSKTGELIESIMNDYLGLPPKFLKQYNDDRSWDWMNVKRYFPATETENVGISSHKDSNVITIILQDNVGGLEVLLEGHWVPIVPSQTTLVVNVGDIIQVLTNERFKSALHRVTRQEGRSRYSFSFFYSLHGDKLVEPFSQFTTQIGDPPKYNGFLYKDYLAWRIRNKTNPAYKGIGIDAFCDLDILQ